MSNRKNNSSNYGPENPHPLSRLKTELVWEGVVRFKRWGRFYFALPMLKSMDRPEQGEYGRM